MLDQKFGVHGGEEPRVCGCGCDEPVRGRHANTYNIPNTAIYYRILAKHADGWTDERHTALSQQHQPAPSPILIIPDPAPYESAPYEPKAKK